MELALDPELPICDPHHHLWNRLDDRYLMEELRSDTNSGHNIRQTVFIQCYWAHRSDGPTQLRPVGETESVVNADPTGFVAGIVAFADLRLPEISDVLAAHNEAGDGRFRGIRQISTWDANLTVTSRPNPPRLLSDPDFRKGFTQLGLAGLSFDAWLYHPQIAELTDLARAHPDVQIILDHLGGPIGIGPYQGHRDEVMRVWRSSLRDLATCPNVALKVGGVGMPIFGMDWHEDPERTTSDQIVEAWGKQILWCIELFGVDRCMFESNFPADKVSCSYDVIWNAFKKIAINASPSEKQALFHDTAVNIYRL